jgi:hypothetical protein
MGRPTRRGRFHSPQVAEAISLIGGFERLRPQRQDLIQTTLLSISSRTIIPVVTFSCNLKSELF